MAILNTEDIARGVDILTRLEWALKHEGLEPSRTRQGRLIEEASLAIMQRHGAPNHWEVWCLDKLHDAVASVLRNDWLDRSLALRLLCGAREYKGRLGGHWPCGAMEACEAAEAFVASTLEAIINSHPACAG